MSVLAMADRQSLRPRHRPLQPLCAVGEVRGYRVQMARGSVLRGGEYQKIEERGTEDERNWQNGAERIDGARDADVQ